MRNEAGRKLASRRREGGDRPAHRHVLQPVAQGDEVQGAGVLHRHDLAEFAADAAGGGHVGGEELRRRGQRRLVVHRADLDVVGQAHRPGAVVVGAQAGVGVGLLLEQRLGEPAVRLVQAHQIRPSGDLRVAGADVGSGPMHFDRLPAQQVHHAVHARLVGLPGRQEERVGRGRRARRHAVRRLLVEVLDQHRRHRGGQLERREDAGLRVVDRVADRPVDLARRRRIRAEPLARQLAAAQPRLLGVGAALVEDLVHPEHAVVVSRGKAQVAGRPHVHEPEVPHAGHAVAGQLVDLVVREERQLRE